MLRKASSIDGYAITASDGRIGTVNDFLFEDSSWLVRWLVVDTGDWLSGRKVLLSPSVEHGIALAGLAQRMELKSLGSHCSAITRRVLVSKIRKPQHPSPPSPALGLFSCQAANEATSTEIRSQMARLVTGQSKVISTASLLALALGAVAFGAAAIGVLAIGRLVVGRVVIKKASFGALEVDELTVRKLRVVEHEGPIRDGLTVYPVHGA
jgi:hypothetical protein